MNFSRQNIRLTKIFCGQNIRQEAKFSAVLFAEILFDGTFFFDTSIAFELFWECTLTHFKETIIRRFLSGVHPERRLLIRMKRKNMVSEEEDIKFLY